MKQIKVGLMTKTGDAKCYELAKLFIDDELDFVNKTERSVC